MPIPADAAVVWDPGLPFPGPDSMRDLEAVTHVSVERAQPEGYHYLHESTLAVHRGAIYLCWANHREAEFNVCGEVVRGSRSFDAGLTWEPARMFAAPPDNGSNSYNQPVLSAHQERLWGFFTRWDGRIDEQELLAQGLGCCNPPGVGPQPSTEIFLYDDAAQTWRTTGGLIPGFLPFHPPTRMRDGNWIMGGEIFWYEAAVAISEGDDFRRWRVVQIPRPEAMQLLFPETALLDFGERLLAVCRYRGAPTAPVSQSTDCGRTWTTLQPGNFPMCSSQPCAGTLRSGQHFLIGNDAEAGRQLLSIAWTEPRGTTFVEVRKIRHQGFPLRRHFPGWASNGRIEGGCRGQPTEWSYPAAIEHDGKLYVSYTQGKEDCAVSIIHLRDGMLR